MENVLEVLEYFDSFGTSFNFYIEKNRKLYTPFGGILTILSLIVSTILFIHIYLDDFLHNHPSSTTFTEKNNHRKIKPKEEKIWIPWRIRDFGGKTIDHTDLLFPIIYYYKGVRNNELKSMDTSYELINYKLCNETSMINNTDLIDIELDQLYCIDMEDLIMGGSWDSDFLFLITLDIYGCKNGIDYDKDNENCTTYEDIIEFVGENNCLEFEMYYPVVHYQPMNETTPFFIQYENYFYHLSRFSNKIDRIYLQQHILRDDRGWFNTKEEVFSRWGCTLLNGDSYATGNKRDLMNEGSTSRFYSFNIYLKPEIIYYKRSYKKIQLIIADGLPIINIIIIIFKMVAKILKVSSANQKLTELLFENLKEKKSYMKITNNNLNFDKRLNKIKKNFQTSNKKSNDFSSVQLTIHDPGKKLLLKHNYSISNDKSNNDKSNYNISNCSNNVDDQKIINTKGKEINKSIKSNDIIELDKSISKNILNFNQNSFFKKKNISQKISLNKNNIKIDFNSQIGGDTNNVLPFKIKTKTRYLKKQLFPYKYYLYSIFIKNIDISNRTFCFTKKFIVVYNFICQLFDISSYLILQREFQTMKNTVIEEKQRNIIEKEKKITVNERFFNINMKECLDGKKLSIFGKMQQKSAKNVRNNILI